MFTTSLVEATSSWLARRSSRRSFLQRVAVVGSALSVSGLDYVLRPGTAYASVCGSGASCASGWTALCCTVNNGVNQCPPGSFAAGWWKADGARLCGGKARYYVDCQARCTECHCQHGSHYCGRDCWNCKPHCVHGTCDERHVCRNLFRYGQCHQEIRCSGPVWCRAISCTPPWVWESCSRSSATDNNTRSHSAPCLPRTWTPMQRRYERLGSQASPLGASAGPERQGEVGHVQRYEHGRMYSSDRVGVHYVLGALARKYVRLGESGSPLGLPIGDTIDNSTGTGRHNRFQHGSIHASSRTGAHAVWGLIYRRWEQLGMALSSLGLPVTDTITNRDGVGQHNDFEHGTIYTSPAAGTHVVPEAALPVWDSHDREAGPLGYPTADAQPVSGTDATMVTFEHGVIEMRAETGTHAVWGPIFESWTNDYGRELGSLGFPTSDVYDVDLTHERCDFEHGSLVLDKATGTVTQEP